MIVQEVRGMLYSSGEPVIIGIHNGRITSIQPDQSSGHNVYVAPGLIDIQVNGYRGIGFSDENLTAEGVRNIIRELAAQGVTTFLPTLITMPLERLRRNLSLLAKVAADPEWSCSIPGFHLEGPYISAEEGFRGAHDARWIRDPNWDEFTELNRIANGLIKLVTLAPEKPGALEFISRCRDHGIMVGLGHHNADGTTIHRAAEAGARLSTHLGNACANYIHRHNNPLWPQLAEDRLWAGLIADGFHLNADELSVFMKVKGPGRSVLVSDITEMAGREPGEYEWGDKKIQVKQDGRLLVKGDDIFAGASRPLYRGIENVMLYTDCSLGQAVELASANSATLMRFKDLGEVKVGYQADLILFEFTDHHFRVHQTFKRGRIVFQSQD